LNKFTKDLIKRLGEAADHAKGRASSVRVHVVKVPGYAHHPAQAAFVAAGNSLRNIEFLWQR